MYEENTIYISKKAINSVIVLSLSLLTGCFSEATLESNCVSELTYQLDKKYMRHSNLGALKKPEIIRIIHENSWNNNFTVLLNNRSGITIRKTIEKESALKLILLGPLIRYSTKSSLPDKDLLYVSIDGIHTWIRLADLISIAGNQPYEINRQNNRRLDLPVKWTLEASQNWRSKEWQCPGRKIDNRIKKKI